MGSMIALAAVHGLLCITVGGFLVLVYRRMHKSDLILYWAAFWISLGISIGSSQVVARLTGAGLLPLWSAVSNGFGVLSPFLLLFAAASVGAGPATGTRRQPSVGWLVATGVVVLAIAVYHYFYIPLGATPYNRYRPMMIAAAAVTFAWRLAFNGRKEFGSERVALVAVVLLYAIHSLGQGSFPWGLGFYSGYNPTSAAGGILGLVCLTLVFFYVAIERAAEASREAEEASRRFRTLMEGVGVAGIIVSRTGKLEFSNHWLQAALERPAAAIQGQPWIDTWVPAREREQVQTIFDAGFRTGQWPAIHEYTIGTGAGQELSLAWYHTTLRDSRGAITGTAALGVDLGEQQRMTDQVNQALKMETLGRLAGGVAHDFNNHLTVIDGYADLLMARFADADEEVRAMLGYIRKSGETAASLTRQLLAFSRQRQIAPELISLTHVARNAKEILTRLIREDVTLELDLDESVGLVLVDRGQIDNLVLNLAINANDAITGSGIITLATSTRVGRTEEGAPKEGWFAVLSVSDTGSGMDEWTRSRIFEPFFTTKAENKGTGLGLATVHGVVKEAGGWIDVHSVPGQGSEFRVYLPYAREQSVQPAQPQTAARRGQGEKILITEDQGLVRMFAAAALEAGGYAVLHAANGEEAMTFVDDPARDITVLVTDVVMPGMSGDKLARRARASRPGLGVLFLSGYSPDFELNLEGPAPKAFLKKPFTPEQLCEHVGRLIALTSSR